jgi:uncharacterized protein YbjT (DUF2867 family)
MAPRQGAGSGDPALGVSFGVEEARRVFVTGATGYVGRPLVDALVARGHEVRALARAASVTRLPRGCRPVIGDALVAESFSSAIGPGDTVVQLVGTPHPSPSKATEFERVDFASVRASVRAAAERGVSHFVYVSVAHPAPVMHAYVDVRRRGEALIHDAGLPATILRPWYVLGPGHRWPYALLPLYWAMERLPATRPSALRLGLVTLAQMVRALVHAVEHPPAHSRIVEVPEIRRRTS